MGGVKNVLAVLMVAMPAQAQEPLALRDVLARALATQPQLAQAQAQSERAAAAQRELRSSLLPALSADAMVTHFEEPMVVAPLHGFDPRFPPLFDRTLIQGQLQVGYTVWDGGARGARLERAGAQLAAADAVRSSATASVISDVVRRYAELLTARELIAFHEARVQSMTAERARAQRMLEQGQVARVVLLRAEAALSSARADHAVAEAQREVAEHDVARLMSVGVGDVRGRALLPLSVPGDPPTRAEALVRAGDANAELQRLRAQRAATGAGEAEVSAQWWPRVLLGGRYVRYGSGQGDAGGEWQGGMQLSYALFSGGSRPAAQDRARAETRAAAAELAIAEQRVAESVDRALAALIGARARRTSLADAAQQSAEVVRIEQLALDTGAGVQTDYLAAEAELLRVRAALTEARFAEVVAHAELARAMGMLSVAWIEQNVEAGS